MMRGARQFFARLSALRSTAVPDAPSLPVRDPWPGEPAHGARILKGEIEWLSVVRPLRPGVFPDASGSVPMLAHVHGFSWLRDLRALGTAAGAVRDVPDIHCQTVNARGPGLQGATARITRCCASR